MRGPVMFLEVCREDCYSFLLPISLSNWSFPCYLIYMPLAVSEGPFSVEVENYVISD